MKRRLLVTVFVLGLLFSIVAPLIQPGTAAADDPYTTIHGGTFAFTDQSNITGSFGGSIGQVVFNDKDISDGWHNYAPASKFCRPAHGDQFGIDIRPNPNWSAATIPAVINVGYRPTTTGSCVGTQFNISISNPGGVAANNAEWDGSNIVFPLPGQPASATFKPASSSSVNDVFLTNATNDTCGSDGSVITISDSSHGTAYYDVTSGSGGQHSPSEYPALATNFSDSACSVYDPITQITIGGTEGVAATGSGSTGTGSVSGSSATSIGCHIGASVGSVGGIISAVNPLNWLICGVIEGLSQVIGFLDSAIESQLAIGADHSSPDQANGIFCQDPTDTTGTCASYHVAWASFRDIALGLMLIVGLIILISQALGFEVLDAYAIRKALPRLLIAALTISLSWQLMQFAVVLSNDLGYGVRHLIEAPFCSSVGGCNVSVNPFTLGNNLFSPALLVIGSFGIMTLAAAGALSLLIAYTVLVLRQIVVILLIIVSPVAIIAYVLPSTNRTFKLWWESFSKALLMFPLITGMIAVGHVFALISSKSVDTLSQTIAFFAYFAPYFMLPATFRMAGGAISGLGNFVNSRAQPVYGMLSKKRSEKAKARWNKARDNDLWHKDFGKFDYSNNKAGAAYSRFHKKFRGKDRQLTGSIGNIGNRAAAWATDADQLVPYHLGKERTVGRGPLAGKRWKGMPGTKRYSAELAGRIADNVVEQTGKRAQSIAGIHYKGNRAMAGDFEYLGLDTQKALVNDGWGEVERDNNGQAIVKKNRLGQDTFVWKKKQRFDGSLNHTRRMSNVLRASSDDKERLAGQGLWDHRGAIATFQDPEEFRFADLQAAAVLNMAQAGRAEQLDVNANDLYERLGGEAGARLYKAAADTNSRVRVESRFGYGTVAETGPDGTVRYVDALSEEIDPRTGKSYAEGETAKTQISSAGYHAQSSGKGEGVRRQAPAFLAQLAEPKGPVGPGGHRTWDEEQQGYINQINTGRSSYGGDPGQQREWNKMAAELENRLKAQGISPESMGLRGSSGDDDATGAEVTHDAEEAAKAKEG